jgi:Icc protein
MIIAQISDTHLALDTPDAGKRIDDFERVIADINALDPAPDVIVHTGDVVQNGRIDEYAEAIRILSAARTPVYPIVGNKDERANFRAAFAAGGYLDTCAELIEYTVEDFPVRLIMTDTLNLASNKGDFCQVRADHLVNAIDSDRSRPIAVFAHHPPFRVTVGPDPLNFETEGMMEELRAALLRSGHVNAVFCGHVHRGTTGYVENIRASVMPSVATSLRKGEYPPHLTNRPIYHIHRFDPAGSFSTESRIVSK